MTTDFERAREKMVKEQIIGRGIHDRKVLAAMRKVPRHLFVAEELQGLSYADRPLPIDMQQTISQPYMVALMTEALELSGDEKVLEIGTGSGYQAAVLAEICKIVYSVESFPGLHEKASALLRGLGYKNVVTTVADGTRGWPQHQPYDAIIVTAGAPDIPTPLLDQLAEGGRLLIPVGNHVSQQLKKVIRLADGFSEEMLLGCQFVPLRGEHGW
ncbi:protein-L-isoaspartate(D-aspartate) O-methyltransferase [Desulfopila inferna]|uniref:protein-L-isoaspartate(D-aspartate) O-methyltransferase n=1 Tax=Desulfopila inferna TaxID=468528 RepID=UPI0019649361|nr:protein-L-isoaspartate(D-aspartate) O-methyltransferase [Desulfopila inferna]MBM9606052.1 protein-L-isoaspartate(D-aspartate) O-methyltransferase [Desulfopila inferna]